MDWIKTKTKTKTKWPYVASFLLFGQFVISWILSILGDVDTACSIAGKPPAECGIVPMMGFLLDPPAWFLAVSFGMGLVFFAMGERRREKEYIERLDSAWRKADEAEAGQAHTADAMRELERRMDQLVERHDSDVEAIAISTEQKTAELVAKVKQDVCGQSDDYSRQYIDFTLKDRDDALLDEVKNLKAKLIKNDPSQK